MKVVKQLLIGFLVIAVMAAALVLSEKYLKQKPKPTTYNHYEPGKRLEGISESMRK